MRRILTALAVTSGLAVVGLVTANAVQAQPSPTSSHMTPMILATSYPPDNEIVVDTPAPPGGGFAVVTARGFDPFEDVTFSSELVLPAALAPMEAPAPRPAMALVVAPIAAPIGSVTVPADAAGVATASVPVGNQPGSVLITATGASHTATTTVQVLAEQPVVVQTTAAAVATTAPAAEEATGGMPPTGTNGRSLLWQVLLAGLAIGLGAVLLVVTTRRRKPTETE